MLLINISINYINHFSLAKKSERLFCDIIFSKIGVGVKVLLLNFLRLWLGNLDKAL